MCGQPSRLAAQTKEKAPPCGDAFSFGAAKGNRTPIPSLARTSSTIEPWPQLLIYFTGAPSQN